jgi:hypothetical protein
MSMTDTESEDYPAERFTRTLRKSTKIEIALAFMIASGIISAAWWARGVSGQLDTLTQAVAKYDPGANAVLTYRVQQLELELAALRSRR